MKIYFTNSIVSVLVDILAVVANKFGKQESYPFLHANNYYLLSLQVEGIKYVRNPLKQHQPYVESVNVANSGLSMNRCYEKFR